MSVKTKLRFFARAGPLADALAMNTFAPVLINGAMVLAAQFLQLIEIDCAPEIVDKLVALGRVLAIKIPDDPTAVLQVAD